MGDQSPITFSVQDIDKPEQQNSAQAQPVPGAAPITFSPSAIDKTTASPSVKMVGPDGSTQQVAPANVAAMRQKNFALTPDNPNTQKMVTVDGKIAYVLPNEVTQFEDAGGTRILPDGRFLVKNMRSDNTDFPDSVPDVRERAVNVVKALGPEQTSKAIEAEKKYWTSKEGLKEEGKGAINVALVGGGTMAALAAPAVAARVLGPTVIPVAGGAGFGGAAAGEIAGPSLASQAATWVGRQLLAHGVKTAMGGLGIGGGAALVNKLFHWW
jgi:hypothetical protein